MKEIYMDAHDEVAAEYLEAHPGASEDEAYDATVDAAWERAQEMLSERAEWARDAARDRIGEI